MNKYFGRLIVVGFIFFLLLSAMTVFSQDSIALRPIGSFSNYSGSNDHAYGYQVMLWANGNKLFGNVTKWNGGLGGHSADIEGARIQSRSGEIEFKLTIRQTDVDPVVITSTIFKGQITGKTIVGIFVYQGKEAQSIGDKGAVKVTLKLEKHISLLKFSGYKAWKKSTDSRYTQED